MRRCGRIAQRISAVVPCVKLSDMSKCQICQNQSLLTASHPRTFSKVCIPVPLSSNNPKSTDVPEFLAANGRGIGQSTGGDIRSGSDGGGGGRSGGGGGVEYLVTPSKEASAGGYRVQP